MRFSFGLTRNEWVFSGIISSLHAIQHLFYRLVPPLIPILAVDLAIPLWQLGMLVSVYMFVGGLFQAPMGVLADRTDRTYLAASSIGLMAVGYVVFASALTVGLFLPSIYLFGYGFSGPYQVMSIGMVVAGIGYSGIHPVGYTLISANIAADRKGTVLGMWGSASKIGDAMAPLLIAVFVLIVPWAWILLGVAVFGFGYAIWLVRYLQRSRFETAPPSVDSDRNKLDESDEAWRTEPRVFFVPIAVLLVFFFAVLFAGNGLVAFAPAFVTDVYGYSLTVLGVAIQPESVANFYFAALLISATLSQLASGVLADRFDYRAVLVAYLSVSTLGLMLLVVVTLTPITLLIVFVLVGSSIFGLNPVRDALVSDLSPDQYEGRTFGYIYTVALVGSSAFPTVIGYLADMVGLQASFGFLALGTVLGLVCVVSLYSSRIYRQDPTGGPES